MSSYLDFIAIEPGHRGGRPCLKGSRIAVADVLGWLASGLAIPEILEDFPEVREEQIRACLAYASHRERRVAIAAE